MRIISGPSVAILNGTPCSEKACGPSAAKLTMDVADRLDAPVLAATGIVLAVVVGVRGDSWPRSGAFAYAALLGASAIALMWYVASEDDYRRGGISRWDAYDAHVLTVAAIAIGLFAAVALVGAAARRRSILAITGFLVSSAAFVLYFAAFLANSLN